MAGERFYEAAAEGARRSAPAALRNRAPIGDVLERWLPARGLVLELASGTGEHVVYFADRFPQLQWQPSDIHPDALASIDACRREAGVPNVRPALSLNAASAEWPVTKADALLSINMVHISPWESALGLIEGASRILPRSAPLILYGPWLEDGVEPAPSNCAFDADLRERDARWGLRRVGLFAEAAEARGLRLEQTQAMPAHNLMLLLRRS